MPDCSPRKAAKQEDEMRKLNSKPGDLAIITADKVENDGLTQPRRCNWLHCSATKF